MNITVVGMGKIGVPLAVQFASKGATVIGYDVNATRVSKINDGRNPIEGEPGVEEMLPNVVASGHLRATTDPATAVVAADTVIVIVPVDIDAEHRPDFTLLDDAVGAITPHLPDGALVIVETTVPVGTSRARVAAKILASRNGTGEARFSFAFSPERVSSGRVLRDLATYPKIVGGVDERSTRRAVEFYEAMLDAPVMAVSDAETAEFSKLAETTYRDVNIALANEFARLADAADVDVTQAIAAANSQPYSHVHRPGVGVGGHCIPVYPYFLNEADESLIAAARRLNDDMARYAVARLARALGSADNPSALEGAGVVILGLAYRANVKESRHSSTFALSAELSALGAHVYVHDPLYSDDEIRESGLEPPSLFPLPVDAIVIQAWHDEYRSLDLRAFTGVHAVLDGRDVLDPAGVRALGIEYVGIGR